MEIIEILTPTSCSKQYVNNSKVARKLSRCHEPIKELKRVETDTLKEARCLIDITAKDDVTLSDTITPFDMELMNAVYTLYVNGYHVFTNSMIAQVLTGYFKHHISEKLLQQIDVRLSILRKIDIKIDYTEEANARLKEGQKPIKKCIFESYLLPINVINTKYISNGTETKAYVFQGEAALFQYASLYNQVLNIPANLYDTHEYFNDTEEAIVLKRYVITQIAIMKNPKNKRNNRLSFEWTDKNKSGGLYEELGYKPNETTYWKKTKKPYIHRVVVGTLKSLVNKNYIRSFKEYRAHGSRNPCLPIKGVEIEF